MNLFSPVVAVAMHDRVDEAFPHGHTDAMLIVFIKTSLSGRLQNLGFGEIDALQGRGVVSIMDFRRSCIQGHGSN
jgi:hypothetical protein